MRSSTLETVSPYATGHVLGLTENRNTFSVFVRYKRRHSCVSWLLHPGDMGPMMRGSWVAQGHARTLEPLSVTGSNRMAGPSNRGPCSASRPGWVHRAPYDDTGDTC